MVVYRKDLCQRVNASGIKRDKSRTNAIQKLKSEGSVGMAPYVLARRCTTHGAVPFLNCSRNAWQTAMSSSFEGCIAIGGDVSVGAIEAFKAAMLRSASSSNSTGTSSILVNRNMTIASKERLYRMWRSPFYPAHHVPIQRSPLHNPEPVASPGFNNAPAVR